MQDLELQHAAYRKNPAGAAGVNTTHVVHRLNFVNPKSKQPLTGAESSDDLISVWGRGWWTKRLVGFGALKEPEVQQQATPGGELATNTASRAGTTAFYDRRMHDVVKDPYGQQLEGSAGGPFKNIKRKLGIFDGIANLFKAFHRSDHSLDNMVQVMDQERIQFHYHVQVVGIENADNEVR